MGSIKEGIYYEISVSMWGSVEKKLRGNHQLNQGTDF